MKILKMAIFLLVLFIAVGGVCAADHVSQDMIGEDVVDSLESTQSDIALENEQNEIYSVDDSTKTYTDLINEINNTQGNVLDLKYDYKFNNSTDGPGIAIFKDDFVINGNGHAIDGSNLNSCFGIFAKNVTINNLTIRNTSFSIGSAIYIAGGSLTTNNVIFENNTVSGDGVVNIEGGSYVSNYDKFIGSSAATSGTITMKKISAECVERIRRFAPDNAIVIGSYDYNDVRAVKDLDAPQDSLVAYSFHCYEPHDFTHQGAYWDPRLDKEKRVAFSDSGTSEDMFEELFESALAKAAEHGADLYCGEYGVIDVVSPDEALEWYKVINKVFERHGISRAAWSYKQMDFGISDARMDKVREELTGCL